jgi:hypothetical protein
VQSKIPKLRAEKSLLLYLGFVIFFQSGVPAPAAAKRALTVSKSRS